MEPISTITGSVVTLDRNDVDTDAIMPKQFLKRVERTGFGPFAFYEDRYLLDQPTDPATGLPPTDPDFVMNRPEHTGATILLTGRNFGSGSSREHAPWGLEDAGFRAVVAVSFADIFRNNCAKVGLVTVELPEDDVRTLMELVAREPSLQVRIDLDGQTLTAGTPEDPVLTSSFPYDPAAKHNLLHGLDDISLTLTHADAIDAHEAARPGWMPSVA